MMRSAHVVLLAVVCIMCVGCAGQATLYTTSGHILKGKIEGSSETHLYVDQGLPEMTAIERSRVLDINHPGRALIIIGAIGSLVYVPASAGIFLSANTPERRRAALAPTITLSALPLITLALGVYKWRRSDDAAFHPVRVDFVYPPPEVSRAADVPTTSAWASFEAVTP